MGPGAPPLSVMPQPGADVVPVLYGVSGGGVDGAQTEVNEQTALNAADVWNSDLWRPIQVLHRVELLAQGPRPLLKILIKLIVKSETSSIVFK